MKVEWFKRKMDTMDIYPKDKLKYKINSDVVAFTEKTLKEYGKIDDGNEGIVYWAGSINGNCINIDMAIAPEAETSGGSIKVPHISNLQVVLCLSKNNRHHLGQVHSHPGSWVGHSSVDDEDAAFKKTGLLSVVVPFYGRTGMLDLEKCGIHRFGELNFFRLKNWYIKRRFSIIETNSSIIIDQRNGAK